MLAGVVNKSSNTTAAVLNGRTLYAANSVQRWGGRKNDTGFIGRDYESLQEATGLRNDCPNSVGHQQIPSLST